MTDTVTPSDHAIEAAKTIAVLGHQNAVLQPVSSTAKKHLEDHVIEYTAIVRRAIDAVEADKKKWPSCGHDSYRTCWQCYAERGKRITELEAIVARLPLTADGVPVVQVESVFSVQWQLQEPSP